MSGETKKSDGDYFIPLSRGWVVTPSGISNPCPPTSPTGAVQYQAPVDPPSPATTAPRGGEPAATPAEP